MHVLTVVHNCNHTLLEIDTCVFAKADDCVEDIPKIIPAFCHHKMLCRYQIYMRKYFLVAGISFESCDAAAGCASIAVEMSRKYCATNPNLLACQVVNMAF